MKELLKNKTLKLGVLLVLIGLLVINFSSLLYYGIVGAIVILVGVITWSFLSTVKENYNDKKTKKQK